MSDLNPLTIGDTPEEYIENEDGSVDILEEAGVELDTGEFYSNLAEVIEESKLNSIASQFIELVEKDKEARKKRDEQYEEGIRRTGLGNDAPGGAQFEGASRVVHPVMAEACVDFQSSSIKELFPPSGPVRTDYVGAISAEESARGDRKAEFMNWQLTKQMPEYYDELEQLLSQLPLGGAQYMKIRFDEAMKRPVAEFVPIDEILLPYAATSFYTSPRVTHRQLITQHTFESRVNGGFYREIDVVAEGETPEQTSAALATDKVEGLEDTAYNEDGLRAILEIYAWQEFEGDDNLVAEGSAPYVIHIDEYSEKVLAIYRNWDDQDPTMEKLDHLVEFKFIPWRGAYGIGLPHLIGGLSAALTGALRALLDSAHINNAPSMLKLKTGRTVGGNTQVNVTEVTEVEAPPNVTDIRQIAMPMPFNQPSPVLFQLMGFLTDSAKGVVSTAEEKIANASNQMPVGTAMALIEQGSKVFSAIHARMHRSQAKVLEILHRINAKFMDVQDQQHRLGKVICTPEDFQGSLGVVPASDPNIFSESQRYAQMQALMQMSQDPRAQWNINEIYHRMLTLMHVQQPEKLLAPVVDPVTADPLTENSSVMTGVQLKAAQQQDHLSHIQAHLGFLASPLQLQNPLAPLPALNLLLAHISEHIQMHQVVVMTQVAQQAIHQANMSGQQLTPDAVSAMTVQQAQTILVQQLTPFLEMLGQVQQELQKRTPPAPMPPEVQASIQIAQMDIQRKSQYDQATLQAKQAEQQAKQQMEAAQFQADQAKAQFEQHMEASRQQFEQYMAQQQQLADQRTDEMKNQIQLLINEQDNKHHQMTELLKNHEDNQTEIFIAQMKEQLASIQQPAVSPESSGPDNSAQLQQVQMMLDQLSKQQTNDSLSAIMQGLQAAVEHLGKPKMIIRDQQGKVTGVA